MPVDYIPAKIADFSVWLLNFATLIAAAPTDYGLIAGDATAISAQNTAFQAAYLVSSTPATRTTATIATTNGARLAAEAVIRPYAMRINANQTVSDAQRVDLGLTVRTVVPTPVPPPTTSPVLVFQAATPLQHTLQFRDSLTPTSKAKPLNVIGLELFVAVGTVAAVDPSQASYRLTATKAPFNVPFAEGDRGKIATYFARWTNRSGAGGVAATGPWSVSLVSGII